MPVAGEKKKLLVAAFVLTLAAPAQDRRPRLDVEHYAIEVEINPRAQTLAGTAIVRFAPDDDRLSHAVFELNNALQVSRVVDGAGSQLGVSRNQQDSTIRVSFPEPLPKGKPATIIFHYDGRLDGKEDSPVYGVKFAAIHEEFSFLLYPARWFPVSEYTVDRFAATLKITVPDGYQVVASGLATQARAAGKTAFEFDNARPGFPGSLAVVKGEPFRSTSQGVTTFLHFRGENSAMANAYGEEVAKVMTFLTGLFGLPLQVSLTVIETENGAPNGYSAPGLLFLNPKAISRAVNSRLIVNQIARQWWGNSVSPTSRGHVWLMNGAARMAELLWVEQSTGPGALETEVRDTYIEALTVDDPPVIQASRLDDYSPEYWAVTGAKGAAVFAMLRTILGGDNFAKLMKSFLEANAGKAINTDDFRKAAEQVGGRSFQGFFVQWIESSGAPEFKLEYTVFRTQNGFRIMGKISQDLDTFRMPVELKIETEGNPESKTVDVVGTSTEFVVESFGRPKRVSIDPNYRVLRYDSPTRVAVAIRRGEMFAEISEFAESLREYQKALDVNRNSSLAHYRVAEIFLLQGNYQSAANEFREALNGDLEPKWTEVWAHINLGKIFDITDQRERAVNEYNQAIRTKDNTQGAQEEAAKYLKEPYQRPARER